MKESITKSVNPLETLLESLTALPALVEEVARLRGQVAELRQLVVVPRSETKGWYKLKEAAKELNTSQKTVRRWIDRGFLTRNAACRHILIPSEDVANLKQNVW